MTHMARDDRAPRPVVLVRRGHCWGAWSRHSGHSGPLKPTAVSCRTVSYRSVEDVPEQRDKDQEQPRVGEISTDLVRKL